METFNFLLTALQEQIASILGNLIGSVALGLLMGLVTGVALIITIKNKGGLKRSNSFWSVIASLNFVYIPILCLVLGGFIGTVRGVHKVSGNFIDTTTQPIVKYAQGYLPGIQNFVNTQLDVRKGQDIQIEDLIAQQMASEFQLSKGSYEYQAMFKINEAILGTIITLKGPGSLNTLRSMDVTNMPKEVFNVLPDTLHEVCDGFFFFKYLAVFTMFLPFLMIPVVEYLVYHFFGKRKGLKTTSPSRARKPKYIFPMQSEFV